MKSDTQLVKIATFLTALLFLAAYNVKADDYNVWTDFFKLNKVNLVVAGTFTSDHRDQCNPWCAYEKNGGHGWQVGIFGHIILTNSFKDPGSVKYIEAYDFGFNYETIPFEIFKAIKLDLPIWIMWIEGYVEEKRTDAYYVDSAGETRNVKEYEPMVVGPVPWVVEQISVNPIFITEKLTGYNLTNHEFWITYNIIHFPVVRIQWWSIEFKYNF